MPLFKLKNGKSSKSQNVKKDDNNLVAEDIQQNNTIIDNGTKNDNNTMEVKLTTHDNITQDSLVEEPKEFNSYEGNVNRIIYNNENGVVNGSLGRNSKKSAHSFVEFDMKNVQSMTSINTTNSKNTDKTHGTVTFNSNSSVNENAEETTERVPNVPKLNTSHKRNSIFRSFSKMRRKSKSTSEDKKYKSAP
ncbi:hypothetical protein PIROE2DRAFT_9884 [Piromyces sp. E2]|nr:hypothetical protein PIROE2DRAFT_9884 [Piromyces sp. E2]|eukprot:OUM63533.1 hypothetical protein PIROE2DRAFT_9884 [Piromyces sp. E2]